jgi:hypothetical protein
MARILIIPEDEGVVITDGGSSQVSSASTIHFLQIA